MRWTDDAIVLSSSRHAEHALIVRLLTRGHGVHAGLVRGTRKHGPLCQPGNLVRAAWTGRLEEHLGSYALELQRAYAAAWFDDKLRLASLSSLCALIGTFLPEREPHPEIFAALEEFLTGALAEEHWLRDYVRLEFDLLRHLGFGLDLRQCAATGATDDLVYVSPKSGRAVSRTAGEPYRDKLLPLPVFLHPHAAENGSGAPSARSEIIDGLRLTRYFLQRHVSEPHRRLVPASRDRFAGMVETLAVESAW